MKYNLPRNNDFLIAPLSYQVPESDANIGIFSVMQHMLSNECFLIFRKIDVYLRRVI